MIIETAIAGVSIISVIVNWVVGCSLSAVWNMVNSLQIVAHFPLLDVVFPGNIQALFTFFTSISKFDLIPFEPLVIKVFRIDKDEGAFSPQLARMEYNYKTCLANLSATFCIYTAMTCGMLIHAIASRLGIQN